MEANVFHYNCLIDVCQKSSEWHSAVASLDRIRQLSMSLDATSLNSALRDDWQHSLLLLGSELRNLASFNTVLRALDRRSEDFTSQT